MPQLYRLILLSLLLLVTSNCKKNQPDAVSPTPTPTPAPSAPRTRVVTIMPETAGQLLNAKAYSTADSLSMDKADKKIAVPRGEESLLYFLDKTSGEIVAVVRVDSTQQEVRVNAASVTKGIFDLLPAYMVLSPAQRARFDREVPATKAYQDLLGTVATRLQGGKPIYAVEATFTAQVRALNQHLLQAYLGDPLPASGPGRRLSGYDDFTQWISNANGSASFQNQVYSYVNATFTPIGVGTKAKNLLAPQVLTSDIYKWERQPLAGVADGCYTLRLNQGDGEAIQKNILKFTTGLTSAFLGYVIGKAGAGSDQNECIAAITGSLANDVGTTLMGAGNVTSVEEVMKKALEIVWNGAKQILLKQSCRATFSEKVLVKVLAKKALFFLTILDTFNTAADFVECLPYLKAVGWPLDLSQQMQFYQGQHISACLKVVKDGTLKASYGPGEVVLPGVAMRPNSTYAAWKKSGFKIKWSLAPGHGSTNLYETSTGNDGVGTVGWMLPQEDGTYQLTAEVKDQEGDHLEGSPLTFQATVKVSDLLLLTGGSTKVWRATRTVNQNGNLEQSCNSTLPTLSLSMAMALRFEQFIANGAGGACQLNTSNASFVLGSARVLTFRGTAYNGAVVDELYQITKLDAKNLELSGITDPAKRYTLVNP